MFNYPANTTLKTIKDDQLVTSSTDGERFAVLYRYATTGRGQYMNFCVRIYNFRSGERLCEVDLGTNWTSEVSLSPDGEYLAVRSGPVAVFNASTGEKLKSITCQDNFSAMEYSPDGNQLALENGDESIVLINTLTWAQELTLKGATDPIVDITFELDGRLLAASTERGTIHFWDLKSGQLLASTTLIDPEKYVTYTTDGSFDVPESALEHIAYKIGLSSFSVTDFESLYRNSAVIQKRFSGQTSYIPAQPAFPKYGITNDSGLRTKQR